MNTPRALDTLLDRELSAEYRREATEHIAADVESMVATTESALIVRVQTEWLALSTSLCQGVAPMGAVHPIPHRRNGALLGVTHVQGELLLCVSLATLLGLPKRATQEGKGGASGDRLLIVKGEGGVLTFPVQQVHGVHRYRPEDLHEVPATLAHANSRFTLGMLEWNGRWVARLDDALVLGAIARMLA